MLRIVISFSHRAVQFSFFFFSTNILQKYLMISKQQQFITLVHKVMVLRYIPFNKKNYGFN